jgi:hypothetical protein
MGPMTFPSTAISSFNFHKLSLSLSSYWLSERYDGTRIRDLLHLCLTCDRVLAADGQYSLKSTFLSHRLQSRQTKVCYAFAWLTNAAPLFDIHLINILVAPYSIIN